MSKEDVLQVLTDSFLQNINLDAHYTYEIEKVNEKIETKEETRKPPMVEMHSSVVATYGDISVVKYDNGLLSVKHKSGRSISVSEAEYYMNKYNFETLTTDDQKKRTRVFKANDANNGEYKLTVNDIGNGVYNIEISSPQFTGSIRFSVGTNNLSQNNKSLSYIYNVAKKSFEEKTEPVEKVPEKKDKKKSDLVDEKNELIGKNETDLANEYTNGEFSGSLNNGVNDNYVFKDKKVYRILEDGKEVAVSGALAE
jgi:hypothetical protein